MDNSRSKMDKMIERARQLLAKAESTTPEEAEALTAAAEKIMLKYSIDEAMLAASEEKPSTIVSRNIHFTGVARYADARRRGVSAAIQAFGTCSTIFWTNKRSGSYSLEIFAPENQIEQLVIIGQSLDVQAMIAMNKWWKKERAWHKNFSTDHEAFVARRDFILGFGYGAAQRIEGERQQAESEVTGSALVLLGEKARADSHRDELHPELKPVRGYRSQDDFALRDGISEGTKANVGTKGVGDRKKIEA